MQEHNRRQVATAMNGGDVQLDTLYRQRELRVSERFGCGHENDSLDDKTATETGHRRQAQFQPARVLCKFLIVERFHTPNLSFIAHSQPLPVSGLFPQSGNDFCYKRIGPIRIPGNRRRHHVKLLTQ